MEEGEQILQFAPGRKIYSLRPGKSAIIRKTKKQKKNWNQLKLISAISPKYKKNTFLIF